MPCPVWVGIKSLGGADHRPASDGAGPWQARRAGVDVRNARLFEGTYPSVRGQTSRVRGASCHTRPGARGVHPVNGQASSAPTNYSFWQPARQTLVTFYSARVHKVVQGLPRADPSDLLIEVLPIPLR